MVLAARPVVGTLDEARDCASEALVQYLEHDPGDVQNLEAFMVTIAKRRAIDHARARTRARLRDNRFAHEVSLTTPDVAEDIAARAEAFWADQQAQQLLQPRVYKLLQLVADGVPLAEVARRLDMTERAAQSHLLRARRVVRAALAQTLAALAVGVTTVRRGWGPAAVTAPLLAAASVLAIGTAVSPPRANEPRLAIQPQTTVVTDADARETAALAKAAVVRRTGVVGHPARRPVTTSKTVLNVTMPTGSVALEKRDDGHQSGNYVEQVVWCLQHLRVEPHYQGCDDGSPHQDLGQPPGDRPLLPAVG
jgi:DNA-directed RNA polymerase specialized sigma24 family protein